MVDQSYPEVQANPERLPLCFQNQYSVQQGQIHSSWWDIAKVIADDVKAATDEASLQAALDNFHYATISALFNMSEEEEERLVCHQRYLRHGRTELMLTRDQAGGVCSSLSPSSSRPATRSSAA